jgi:hypothetical protein
MDPPDKINKYEFVISTQSQSAWERQEAKTFVRKHAMRPFTKRKRGRAIKMQQEELVQHLSRRQLNCKMLPETISIVLLINITASRSDPSTAFSLLLGSPLDSTNLLGAGRSNPFGTYPIDMGAQDHEFIHLSKC